MTTKQSFQNPKLTLTGWIVTGLSCIPLVMSGAMLQTEAFAREQITHLGMPENSPVIVTFLLLVSLLLFLLPKTSVLGAIMLTGYLGGAIFSHFRVGDSVAVNVIVAVLVWAGLYLRDPKLRESLPFRR